MEINGKIYRNLEGQVGYLTEKWDDLQDQINDVRAHLTHYVIVDALPTEDIDTSAVYLVGPLGTAPDQYYEEWVYVQKADESWIWEKLGDTASVDLSGYLEKQTGTTTYSQLYAKHADGGQVMFDVTASAVANAVVKRTAGAQIDVPYTPTATTNATSKDYVDSKFLQKATGASTYGQAYVKAADGTQTRYDISVSANAYSIPYRDADGLVRTKDPVNSEDAVNLSYANDHYVAKQTGTSSYYQAYTKKPDGSQDMLSITDSAVQTTVPFRAAAGQLNLPNQLNYAPGDDQAVSKRYVDAAVGQLLYLHRIYLVITVDASNYLLVRAHLINGSPTALTSLGRDDFARLEVDYGCYGPNSNISNVGNNTTCAVTKMADSFRFDDMTEGYWGFLYQYMSGGSLVSDFVGYGSTMTLTDTVINF